MIKNIKKIDIKKTARWKQEKEMGRVACRSSNCSGCWRRYI